MTVDTVRHLVSIGELIPRCEKDAEIQQKRTTDKAEVFTPSWLCNSMINGIEECIFGNGNHPFNDETETKDGTRSWKTKTEPIFDETNDESDGKKLQQATPKWKKYIGYRCLEVTCGEAPYLTSRYDTVTNEPIDKEDRIGLLDRKIRVVDENSTNGAERKRNINKALSTIYGFEYQGDNLFLARINLLLTWYEAVINSKYDDMTFRTNDMNGWNEIDSLTKAANTISKNVIQMDGITLTVPQREQGGEEPTIETGGSLFGLIGETGNNNVNCADSMENAMPVYACIYNHNQRVTFHDLIDGRGRQNMAFDFVISNPPYHKDGGGRKKIPIYGKFIEDFSDPKIAKHATFVTPDGFVKGGQQLEPLRRELVDNEHLSRVTFHQDKIFKQSVKAAITTFDNTKTHDTIEKTIVHEGGSIEHGVLDWQYRDVVINHDKESVKKIFAEKVKAGENNMSKLVTGRSPFGLTSACFRTYEGKFTLNPDKTHYIKMLLGIAKSGTKDKRDFYWVNPADDFTRNHDRKDESIHLEHAELYKMTFPRSVTDIDKKIPRTWNLGPGVIHNEKYLTIFADNAFEVNNIRKYFLTNFYRAGLSSFVTGWMIYRNWHSLVPIQDFSNDSDIDWSGSLKSIDEQLYRKYGFTDDDIDAINRFVTPAPGYSDPFAYADPRIERNDFASPSLYTVDDTDGDMSGAAVSGVSDGRCDSAAGSDDESVQLNSSCDDTVSGSASVDGDGDTDEQ